MIQVQHLELSLLSYHYLHGPLCRSRCKGEAGNLDSHLSERFSWHKQRPSCRPAERRSKTPSNLLPRQHMRSTGCICVVESLYLRTVHCNKDHPLSAIVSSIFHDCRGTAFDCKGRCCRCECLAATRNRLLISPVSIDSRSYQTLDLHDLLA